MVIVDNTMVDDEVTSTTFCCNLKACKGVCCCLEGGRGAPLMDDEVALIAEAFPHARQYLGPKSMEIIAEEGLVEGWVGSYATPCIDNRECVYVYFDEGIARCAFERAYAEGKTRWQKPLSCHLFPIRVRHVGHTLVRYEKLPECHPAREHGAASNIALVDFLKEPLIRAFGEPWYAKLQERCHESA
jgi:hypothetical protein